MIIYINDERAYLSWLARNRRGFVVDALHRPTRKQPVLHRASCPDVRQSRAKKTHWTTGRHIKACSLDAEELAAWVREEYGVESAFCAACRPGSDTPRESINRDAGAHEHLTHLGQEIVDCVLDVTVLFLDGGLSEYALTVGDVAELLGKTPPQISAAIGRLVADGYLRTDAAAALQVPATAPGANCRAFPTEKALRTLPAFENMSAREIEEECQRLDAATA